MKSNQTLHVLTNKDGKIVGAALLDSASEQSTKVRVQISPGKGQTLHQVAMTPELGQIESAEDFRRLRAEFHVPRGRTELVHRGIQKVRKKQGRASLK